MYLYFQQRPRKMEDQRQNHNPSSVGFCLLPSELIHNILLSLALPDILRMKLVNKFIAFLISDCNFVRECNSRLESATWLFIYKKRWRCDGTLHGFSDCSDRWFKISVEDFIKPVTCPGDDIYLLTANGNVLLFASNTQKAVFAVNLVSRAVKKIPPCPLGPRGTSLWRRSGMKLVTESGGGFRFLFAEFVGNHPVLFEYNSETNTWHSSEPSECRKNIKHGKSKNNLIFLTIAQGVVVATGSEYNSPIILRPRFINEQNLALDSQHVYGDGYLLIIRSTDVTSRKPGIKMLSEIQLWALCVNSRSWQMVSRAPSELVTSISKPHGVMMARLEGREGVVRAVLVTNVEGSWHMIRLSYNQEGQKWSMVSLPDCKMEGSNMAGITFSCGLTLT